MDGVINSNLYGSSFYNVYYYEGSIYKVVGFNRMLSGKKDSSENTEPQSYDKKLDSSISRTRKIILDYALCNKWSYFCTFTLDKTKYNRFDLNKFRKDFSQWIRDQRKKYPGVDFKYLLIPEMHQDGAWHMHGLLGDISDVLISFAELHLSGEYVPYHLVNGGYFNWTDYQNKFGFCSLGVIKDPIRCAFYMSKYITKQLISGNISVNSRSVYNSYGLNKPFLHNQVFGFVPELENVCTYKGEFCSVGMTKKSDNCDWSYSMEFCDIPLEPLFSDDIKDIEIGSDDDMFYQMSMGCYE